MLHNTSPIDVEAGDQDVLDMLFVAVRRILRLDGLLLAAGDWDSGSGAIGGGIGEGSHTSRAGGLRGGRLRMLVPIWVVRRQGAIILA